MLVLDSVNGLDFAKWIRPGDSVVCGQGLAEPVALTQELVKQRGKIGRFEMFVGPTFADTFNPACADAISLRSYCGTGNNAALAAAGALDIVPNHYSDLPYLFEQGKLPCDVALLTATDDDPNSQLNLGLANDYVLDAARRARTVIIEVNGRVPWVNGAQLPSDIIPHVLVRTEREPLSLEPQEAQASKEENAIAQYVRDLIPDGATLELGVGSLPDVVLNALCDHRDLGIHTGVLGDGVMALMSAGVITNARKPSDVGVSVAGMLMGSRRLFDFAHRNPAIRLAPPSVTHDSSVLRCIPNFFALNGAVEIDLSGQVNAESLNGRYVGAIGGQLDFMRGANRSPGGGAIVLMTSTARNGAVSRIVPALADGVVTTPRSDVDIVVTEWGVARVRGMNLRERAAAIASIAHPRFREELERAAHTRATTR